jgi:hypothetical protein
MSESVDSVKEVISTMRSWSERYRTSKNESAAERFDAFADKLDVVLQDLVRLTGLTTALPPDLGNIFDLPQELIEELSVAKTDELEDQIVTVINAYGGTASLDQVLVGLFRKFKVLQKRRFIQNKLYRMEMVWALEGKKGIYTTSKPAAGIVIATGVEDQSYDDSGTANGTRSDLDDDIPF